MTSANPFAEFRIECLEILSEALTRRFPDAKIEALTVNKPSNPQFGQLASSICFELAKKVRRKPSDLALHVVDEVNSSKFYLVERVEPVGGYVNFYIDFDKFNALTLESIRKLGKDYGFIKTEKPVKVIVEHTSVNPLHPIHIGQARNPMLGDALSRILRARGHSISSHYYIDDVGRQSSVVAYGYEKLGKPIPDEKADHFVGKIYTVTACIVEIKRLRGQLELAKLT